MINRLIATLKSEQAQGLIPATAPQRRFIVAGWTRRSLNPELGRWFGENGISYTVRDFGPRGTLFLIHSHPDVANTEEASLIKLGLAHTAELEPLSAGDLLVGDYVSPAGLPRGGIGGGTTTICMGQHAPALSVYQSLTSTSQIYYWQGRDWLICADTLRYLVAMVNTLEPEPDAVPHHLLYRTVPGAMTYFRGVSKLLCGHVATCDGGEWRITQAERLDDWVPERQITRVTPEFMADFERQTERLVHLYVSQSEGKRALGVLLSGGVDSTLMASLVKGALRPWDRLRSLSYAMRVPSFVGEMHYARHASRMLGTDHRFYDVFAEDYPRWFTESIRLLAQPLDNEQDPCYLMLARAVAPEGLRYLYSGSAADCLLGRESARRLQQVESWRGVPAGRVTLSALSRALGGAAPNKAYGLNAIAHLLEDINDPLSPRFALNRLGMLSDPDVVERSFGTETIRRVMQYRCELLATYSSSGNLAESVHLDSVFLDVHDEENALVQLMRTAGVESVTPYLDSAFVRQSLTLHRRLRYHVGGQVKWLPKAVLDRRLASPTTRWPKLSGGFDRELVQWMQHGVLADTVRDMDRPAYLSADDWKAKREHPDWLTWNLLNLHMFEKLVLGPPAGLVWDMTPQPSRQYVMEG
jgi:asparagine synthetase B (glutamine-hydrolysing)